MYFIDSESKIALKREHKMSYEIQRRPEKYYEPLITTRHRLDLTADNPQEIIDMDTIVMPTGECRGGESELRPGIDIVLHDLGSHRAVRVIGKFSLAADVCDSTMISTTPLAVEWEGGGTRGKGPGTAEIMPDALLGVSEADIDTRGLINYNTRLLDMTDRSHRDPEMTGRPHLHPVVGFERDERGNRLGITLLHAVPGLDGASLYYSTLNPQLHVVPISVTK